MEKLLQGLYKNLQTDDETNNNNKKLILASMQNEMIKQIVISRNVEIKQTYEEEVTSSIQKLETGKSPGSDGISVEHLKSMQSELLQYIINIISLIFTERMSFQHRKKVC